MNINSKVRKTAYRKEGNMDECRSEGERKIKGFLEEQKIDYLYEHPLCIKDKNGLLRIWYPDFTLPDYSILIEFFGFSGEQYQKSVDDKKEAYKNSKISMIPVYPKTFEKKWKDYLIYSIYDVLGQKKIKFDEVYNQFKGLEKKIEEPF